MFPDLSLQNASPVPEPGTAVHFLLRLARALHSYGYPAPRLEETLDSAARHLGVEAQFFSTPTSIFAAFGADRDQRTYLIRVSPGDTDLAKLSDLYDVTRDVLAGRLDAASGADRIDDIVHRPSSYGVLPMVVAFVIASSAAARFLGGGWPEIGAAGLVGLIVGILAQFMPRSPGTAQLFEPLAAFCASTMVVVLSGVFGPFSVFVATIGGLIMLVPGLTVTIAMRELATRHLVSGTARLAGAFVVFVGMVFGVALGNRVGASLAGGAFSADPGGSLPGWTLALALVMASIGFAVLLRARPWDLGWIVLAGAVAYAGGTLGGRVLGGEIGVFAGAFGVGVVSNLFARVKDRPSAVMSVPGILLLVPGSVGFRGFVSMLDQQVVAGVEAAFTMILMAVSLAAGLLVANVVVAPGGNR